jgi:hypothetical protein
MIIEKALERANVESVPYYKQQFVFKLVKLHEINHANWNQSDTVQEVQKYTAKL